jgi:hypothetical protein
MYLKYVYWFYDRIYYIDWMTNINMKFENRMETLGVCKLFLMILVNHMVYAYIL